MPKVIGYAAKHSVSQLRPMLVERRSPRANDVVVDILHCGVCHSDVHQVKNEWHNTVYPCMPGHEIVGRVREVGGSVTKLATGDLVGVGCMVDSCRECEACKKGLENYCQSKKGFLATYNGAMREPSEENLTFGGYSESIVVPQDFVLRIPANLDPAGAAPILCAGVTTYSPMKFLEVGKGSKVGIVGLGGLGQMAVKIARALGAEVTVFTEKKEKKEKALALGATRVVLTSEKKEMEAAETSVDHLLSTIPFSHDANPYIAILKRDGVYMVIGCLLPLKLPLDMSALITDRRSVGTTLIGSIAETQEVLDFCGKHGIISEIESISIDAVNDAFEKVDAGEVAHRFVIDMATIKGKTEDDTLLGKVGL